MVTAFFFQDYPITVDNNFCHYVNFLTIWSDKPIAFLGLLHDSTPMVTEKGIALFSFNCKAS
jgi:hypothetical protein